MNTISALSLRGQPQPNTLLYGESSNTLNTFSHAILNQNVVGNNQSPLDNLQNNSSTPISFTPATLNSASLVHNEITMAITSTNSKADAKKKAPESMNQPSAGANSDVTPAKNHYTAAFGFQGGSQRVGLPTGTQSATNFEAPSSKVSSITKVGTFVPSSTTLPTSPNESDLTEVFMPNIGQPLGYVATYPPEANTTNLFNIASNFTGQPSHTPIMSDATTTMTTTALYGKENQSPN
ncbi:hypothetical protein CsatA_026052 [Cannabis sativa]